MHRIFSVLMLVVSLGLFAQEEKNDTYYDLNFFAGNIALHNNYILHLISGHPNGVIFGWNKKTHGEHAWEQQYNYPDYGASFVYQDFKNESLGVNYGLLGHYNFYFFRRHLMLRLGQGIGYNTNPYHKTKNPKNIAFGSHLLSATYVLLNYKKENLFKNLGLQVGLTLTHFSNANLKAPNTGINTVAFNLGLLYSFNDNKRDFITTDGELNLNKRLKYNFALRSGLNESDIVGSGQYPFYIISGYVDKRLNNVSAIQLGAEVFFSNFLKELIYYQSVSFPEENVSGQEDYKRVGVFAGHELFINKLSVETQLGYYIYYPFDFEGRTYVRLGLKRYFGELFFGAISLKSHGAKAEALEFGIGVRL
ncbi:MAG: acyloxyacyl hydrolase [Winogradskyella sp.]|uniref:acyloxyacyl hydrolase n=1 Tax=Winogradskyella sp. TaxID=1883156 RepID=UPI0017DB9B93|nr:acyloxyacyl hydrolase [Winogradskyella sp.]